MIDSHILVLGGGQIGCRIAEDLLAEAPETRDVGFIDGSRTAVERATAAGIDAVCIPVDGSGSSVVEAASGVDVAILVTGSDSTNLLLSQRLRMQVPDATVVVVIDDPRNREVFETLGVEVVCTAKTVSAAVRHQTPGFGAAEATAGGSECGSAPVDGNGVDDSRGI